MLRLPWVFLSQLFIAAALMAVMLGLPWGIFLLPLLSPWMWAVGYITFVNLFRARPAEGAVAGGEALAATAE